MKQANVIGQVFSRFTIQEDLGANKHGQKQVLCLCICGKEKIVVFNELKQGRTKSCGCLQKDNMAKIGKEPGKVKNLTGQKFGKLIVIQRSDPPTSNDKNQYALWDCQCSCGNIIKGVPGRRLRVGDRTTCGCGERDTETFLNIRLDQYQRTAKQRGLDFVLSREEFTLLLKGNCYYCGALPRPTKRTTGTRNSFPCNGIDRVDNTLGYLFSNCVSCCTQCNTSKGSLSYQEFVLWVQRISQHLSQRILYESIPANSS